MTGAGGWRRSSYCAAGDCLEARLSENGKWVWLRTGGWPHIDTLPVERAEWEAFVKGVKAGELDDLTEAAP